MRNPEWGALGFLTKTVLPESDPEPVFASSSKGTSSSPDVGLRIEKAKQLPLSKVGYESALDLNVWLSKGRKAIPVEHMDDSHIKNTIRMIMDGRHPVLTNQSDKVTRDWVSTLEFELHTRPKEK